MTDQFDRRFTQLDARNRELHDELDDILHEESARTTLIGDEEFDNREWLFAEARELERERLYLYGAITTEAAQRGEGYWR